MTGILVLDKNNQVVLIQAYGRKQIPVVSGAFVFLGGMSLELYLLHMNLLHYMFPNVTDSVLWSTVLAGIATLVLGYVMYRVCRHVLGRYNAVFERISANNTSV